jgi:5-methylthioribose kinase
MFLLDADAPDKLAHYLLQQNWLAADETIISLTKPGEGNMNYVLRITTNLRTFIIKQSRAYVEKYPQIAAPATRVIVEATFYKKIAAHADIQTKMPALLGLNSENNILILEDLGAATDYAYLYALENQLSKAEIQDLIAYLNALHSSFEKPKIDEELANIDLRLLNFEHIFNYPFLEDNGFNLDTVQAGLQDLAMVYKKNDALKAEIKKLGQLYMANGKYLLHGDYYPASWLKTTKGTQIIDPEFCYFGQREFDLGVLLAHLYLTQQPQNIIDEVAANYYAYAQLDAAILDKFVGIEIMRRLIGLAQLPLQMDLADKAKLMNFAHHLIMQ